MLKGAHYVHERLKDDLIHYLKSQYLGQSEVLLKACADQMAQPGNLWSRPYIESSPAYESIENGITTSSLPSNLKSFFNELAQKRLGVYTTPFRHQVEALENVYAGNDLFVSTGTGSGKTECFMWPILSRLASEAASSEGWTERGVRVIVMYPMNALVADQIGRLRRMIGDPSGSFVDAFHRLTGSKARRPQFGMYTGRTPYSGAVSDPNQDKALAESLERLLPRDENDPYYDQLLKGGKIPAKANLGAFIENIREGKHITLPDDAEMITRFEMQKTCPDILITNYSMLEYMMLRQREDSIWDATKDHLERHPNEKLLFVIDEAHMYRGSAGGEVALLIRRLMSRIGVDRNRVQFILTTASMPRKTEDDINSVKKFAASLTSANNADRFVFLWGHQTQPVYKETHPIDCETLASVDLNRLENSDEERLDELNHFISLIAPNAPHFTSSDEIGFWLADHIIEYKPFQELLKACRGSAISFEELASSLFPGDTKAYAALDAMLTIAPLAKDRNGNVLFPARMHMLFRGFHGIYACINPDCPRGHHGNGLKLGQIFLNDRHAVCPECNSRVYELYTDRRCGALFLHGFVSGITHKQFLWTTKGTFFDEGQMKELHLYLPMEGDELPPPARGRAKQHRCWLDIQNGYVTFDDSDHGRDGFRELWYSIPAKPRKDNPDLFTFGSCPKCKSNFSHTQIRGFSTRGNEPFYNLIQSQFQEQSPASMAKLQDEQLPNDGRKVLLFSDSRQKAARLARDMSISSDNWAIRKLFLIALEQLAADRVNSEQDPVIDDIYSYIVREAAKQNIDLFSNESRKSFREATNWYKRPAPVQGSRRRSPSIFRMPFSDAPQEMQEHILRLFCSPYNTLIDNGLCYLLPEYDTMCQAMAVLEQRGIHVTEDEFNEVFSAISRFMLVNHIATLGSPLTGAAIQSVAIEGGSNYTFNGSLDVTSAVAASFGAGDSHSYANSKGRVVTDYNHADFRVSGMYGESGAATNTPGGSYKALIVAANSDVGLQITGGYTIDNLYFRGWHSSGGTYTAWRTVLHSGNYNSYAPSKTGTGASGSWGISITGSSASCTGNAATATKAATLTTARTLTIGSTGKTFNGSANVSWTLAEIGAAAASHTHSYAPLTGAGTSGTWGISITGNAATASNSSKLGGLSLGNATAGSHPGANVVVRTDANGYLNVGWINTVSGTATGTPTRIYCSQDAYLRYYAPDNATLRRSMKAYITYGTSLPTSGMATGDFFIKI